MTTGIFSTSVAIPSGTNYNWNYTADSNHAVIYGSYDYASQTYNFTALGSSPGTMHATLKYVDANGQWIDQPVTIVVDQNLNVTTG